MAKLPTVVSNLPPDMRAFVNRVRETLDGKGNNKLVTVDDLVSGGIASPGPGGTIVTPGGGGGVINTPATPKGISVEAAIQNIIVTWDDPLYYGHAYAEVWGSSTNTIGDAVQIGMAPGSIFIDAVGPSASRYYWVRFVNILGTIGAFNDIDGTLGTTGPAVSYLLETLTNAALSPTSPYSKFAVRADLFYVVPEVDFNQTSTPTATAVGNLWYHPTTEITKTWNGSAWADFSATLPFIVNSAPQTINGVAVPAGVYMDAAFIKNGTITNAKIGNAAIDDAKIVNLSAAKLTAGSISVGSYIQSSNYVLGSQGWKIDGNGSAELAAASIRGKVTAAQVDTRGLSVLDENGGVIISTNTLKTLNDVAANTTRYVAVGANGATCFSIDGIRWPAVAAGTTTLNGVFWSSTYARFYAVGNSGTILSTTDGTAWVNYVSPTTQTLRSISGHTVLIAVGDSGTILRSTDGTTWTAATSGTTLNLNDVVWTGTQFVVVGASGVIRTSTDGILWTARTSGVTTALNAITVGNNILVAVGASGVIRTSTDTAPAAWSGQPSGTTETLNEVAYGSNKFMVVGNVGTITSNPTIGSLAVVLTSTNSTTWTSPLLGSGTTNPLLGVVWSTIGGLSKFALVGSAGTIKYSTDGTVIVSAGVNVFSGDVSGTVAGLDSTVLVNKANLALASDAANILAGQGGIAAGTLAWDAVGTRTSGSGVGLTAKGLAAYNNAGAVTFAIDATNGNASFAGNITAGGTIGGSSVGSTFVRSANYSSGSSGWEISSDGDAEFNQLTVRSGQVVGLLMKTVNIPSTYSGVQYQLSFGTYVSSSPVRPLTINGQLNRFLIYSGTMPAPESASAPHRITALVTVNSKNDKGPAPGDLIVEVYVVSTQTETTYTGELIGYSTSSTPYQQTGTAAGSSSAFYTTSKQVIIVVGGFDSINTITGYSGLLWGVR